MNLAPSEVGAIILFSGAGGVSEGLKNSGITNKVGVELIDTYAKTAEAAGHRTLVEDVLTLSPWEVDLFHLAHYQHLLLQASPPCQGLSLAGSGKGREDVEKLIGAIDALARKAGDPQWLHEPLESVVAQLSELLKTACSDERSRLTFEVARWIIDLKPSFVMLEQVPAALPIWEAYGRLLTALGYSVWTGNVQAEQYGVPQTRKRAMLLASRDTHFKAPVPTHSKFHNRTPDKLDMGVEKWVSMAEALGWGMTKRPSYTVTGGGTATGGAEPFARGAREGMAKEQSENRFKFVVGAGITGEGRPRSVDHPAPTITGKGTAYFLEREDSWRNPDVYTEEDVEAYRARIKAEVEPRVNNQSGTEFDLAWPADRPAPVIAGREIVTMPGANAYRFNGATKSRNDGIRVTAEEAGVLQSFREDYPWQGGKGDKFQQIGNAVPPLLQEVLTRQLLGIKTSETTEMTITDEDWAFIESLLLNESEEIA